MAAVVGALLVLAGLLAASVGLASGRLSRCVLVGGTRLALLSIQG